MGQVWPNPRGGQISDPRPSFDIQMRMKGERKWVGGKEKNRFAGGVSLRGMGPGLAVGLILFGLLADPGVAAPQSGGTYRSSMATDLTNLDLHKTQAQIDNAVLGMTVYEPLFTYDEKFNVKPFLCESYKMSPDGLNLTLNLKKGVKFHNKTEMKAEDVKFCLDRVRDPNLPGAAQRVSLQNVKEVKVTGPYQVQMILSKPIPNIFYILATSVGTIGMMPKKVLESHDNKVLRPIGTGPYEFRRLGTGHQGDVQTLRSLFLGRRPGERVPGEDETGTLISSYST